MNSNKSVVRANTSDHPHRRLFYLIAILIPLVLLLSLEGLLRLVGFGQVYPLFIASPQHQEYLQPNPDVIKRFFHDPQLTPPVGPDTFLFKRNKKQDSLRIVLMGGSTAAGFPYGRFGSPAGHLAQQLKSLYPAHDIEVISVAMASINSYAVLDFTAEVIAIEPDAVLLYAGHNEFLGIMGVGSNYASKGGHTANLIYLKIKEWRLFQLLQSIYYALVSNSAETSTQGDVQRTVMASVAKEKAIPFGSDLYAQGKTQFSHNLDAILESFSQADIPVFVSSIAANESDQRPFASAQARLFYAQGQNLLQQGQYAPALEQFILANDHDELRFRAPSEFNHIIEQATLTHERSYFVPSVDNLRADSPTRIIGNAHMLEHLHPNTRGYFIIAQSFLQGMLEQGVLPPSQSLFTQQALWAKQAISAVDERVAAHKVAVLTSDYPFTDIRRTVPIPAVNNPFDRITVDRIQGQAWLSAQPQLIELFQQRQNWRAAANASALLFDALPEQEQAARVASLLYLRIQDYPLAEYYARKALNLKPKQINYRLTLAEIHYRNNNKQAAIAQLNKVLQLQPGHSKALAIKASISHD